MDTPIIVALVFSGILSLLLLHKVMRSTVAKFYKLAALFLGFVPVLGPVVLLLMFDTPSRQRLSYRNNQVGYSGANREHHERMQKELQRKIDKFKK